ncbi:MAG: aminopeptidase P family protein [Alphaproteobacteria bacterium]|nr:aminopeptidase P family protein [Alphaproteobacteria bacterium]
MNKHEHGKRVAALQAVMRAQQLDMWLQPVADEFQGEYVAAYAQRLPWLCGFSGSAGMGAFWAEPSKKHTLFVDGRYTLQALQEVDTQAIDVINSGDTPFSTWLKPHAASPLRVGFDPWLHTARQIRAWQKAALAGVTFVPANVIDTAWTDRPLPPQGKVCAHPLTLAGQSTNEKLNAIVTSIKEVGADGLLITQPDAVCWLLNIRGSDIPFNPLLLSYLLVRSSGEMELFSFQTSIQYVSIKINNINSLLELSERPFMGISRLMVDADDGPYGLVLMAEKFGIELIEKSDPTQLAKACKNEAELDGMRLAHMRDGLALSKFLHWFDQQNGLDELKVVAELEKFRAADKSYREPSFATIAGSGPNGAIVHYRATEASNRTAQSGELFLLDSGGQYDDGTTDVTRTMAVGAPSDEMKRHFTLVLKGHIALAMAVFPEGTSGGQLDSLARQYLWAAGLDYDHGTGHGVGAHLCVHEGPQRISKRGSDVALREGMIISNEPGYYKNGEYGIRIENLIAVVQVGQTAMGKKLLGFETLTLAPIDRRLVAVELLRADERVWLNAYHERVYQSHQAALTEAERTWLREATAPM